MPYKARPRPAARAAPPSPAKVGRQKAVATNRAGAAGAAGAVEDAAAEVLALEEV